jgi:hypothetical protein
LCRKFAEIFAIHGAPPVSTTPAVNFLTGTAVPAANLRANWHRNQQHLRCTLSCQYLRESSKKSKRPSWILSGLKETDSLKKAKSKSLGTVPLNCLQAMQCFISLNLWIVATLIVAPKAVLSAQKFREKILFT